jgi:hypothetical protein
MMTSPVGNKIHSKDVRGILILMASLSFLYELDSQSTLETHPVVQKQYDVHVWQLLEVNLARIFKYE